MRNLRTSAKESPCTLCGQNDETTVLHHLRVANSGMGMKPPDWHGVAVCAKCHQYFHGEGIKDHKAQLLAYTRQIDRWLQDGVLTFTT